MPRLWRRYVGASLSPSQAAASGRAGAGIAGAQSLQRDRRGKLLAQLIAEGKMDPKDLSGNDLNTAGLHLEGARSALKAPSGLGGLFKGGLGLLGNLGSDIYEAGKGFVPGMAEFGKSAAQDVWESGGNPLLFGAKVARDDSAVRENVVDPTVEQYKYMYGGVGAGDKGLLQRLYEHPLQPLLDVATVASLGAGGAARAGVAPGLTRTTGRAPISLGEGAEIPRSYSSRPLRKGGQVLGDVFARHIKPLSTFQAKHATRRMQREQASRERAGESAAVRFHISPLVSSRKNLSQQEGVALDYALRGWNTPEKIAATREMFGSSLRGENPEGFNIGDFERLFATPEDGRKFVEFKANLPSEVEQLILNPSDRMIEAANDTYKAVQRGVEELGIDPKEHRAKVDQPMDILAEYMRTQRGMGPEEPEAGPEAPEGGPPPPTQPVGPEGQPPTPSLPLLTDLGDPPALRLAEQKAWDYELQNPGNIEMDAPWVTRVAEAMEQEGAGLDAIHAFLRALGNRIMDHKMGVEPPASLLNDMGEGDGLGRPDETPDAPPEGLEVPEGPAGDFYMEVDDMLRSFGLDPDQDVVARDILNQMMHLYHEGNVDYENAGEVLDDLLEQHNALDRTTLEEPEVLPETPDTVEGLLAQMGDEQAPTEGGLYNLWEDFAKAGEAPREGPDFGSQSGIARELQNVHGDLDPTDLTPRDLESIAVSIEQMTGVDIPGDTLRSIWDHLDLSPPRNWEDLVNRILESLPDRGPITPDNVADMESESMWEEFNRTAEPDDAEPYKPGEAPDEAAAMDDIRRGDYEEIPPEGTPEDELAAALEGFNDVPENLETAPPPPPGTPSFEEIRYHVTDASNVDRILQEGLVPQVGDISGMFDQEPGVFTWQDLEFQVNRDKAAMDEQFPGRRMAIAIDTRDLEGKIDPEGFDETDSIYYQQRIGPERIRVLGDIWSQQTWPDPEEIFAREPGSMTTDILGITAQAAKRSRDPNTPEGAFSEQQDNFDPWTGPEEFYRQENPPSPPAPPRFPDLEGFENNPQYPIPPTYVPDVVAKGFEHYDPSAPARAMGKEEGFIRGRRDRRISAAGITNANLFTGPPQMYLKGSSGETLMSGAARMDPSAFVEHVARRERDIMSQAFDQQILQQVAAKRTDGEDFQRFTNQQEVERVLGPGWTLVHDTFPLRWFTSESEFLKDTVNKLQELQEMGIAQTDANVEAELSKLADEHAQEFVRTAFGARKMKGLAVPTDFFNYQRRIVQASDPFDNAAGRTYARYIHKWRTYTLAYMPRWALNTAIGSFLLNMVKGVDPRHYIGARRMQKEGVFAQPEQAGVELGNITGLDYLEPGMHGATEKYTGVDQTQLGERIVEWVQKVEDHFRRASFVQSLDRVGKQRMQEMGTIITNVERRRTSPLDEDYLRELLQDPEAVKAAIDDLNKFSYNFAALGPYERRYVRLAVPFWGWYKFVSQLVYRLPVDYPGRTNVLANLGYIGNLSNEEMGAMPEWLRGIIPLDLTKGKLSYLSTMGINPFSQFINPTGPEGPIMGTLRPSQFSPPIQATLSAIGYDTLRGGMVPISPESGVGFDYFNAPFKEGKETSLGYEEAGKRGLMGLLRATPQFRMFEEAHAGGRPVYPENIPYLYERPMAVRPGTERQQGGLNLLASFFGLAPKKFDIRNYQQSLPDRAGYGESRRETQIKRLKRSNRRNR